MKNSRVLLKAIFTNIMVFSFFFMVAPEKGYASPMLPSHMMHRFYGSLEIDGGGPVPVAGFVTFTLGNQTHTPYDYLDEVWWKVEFTSSSGEKVLSGSYTDFEAIDAQFYPQDIASLDWSPANYDSIGSFSIKHAGSYWGNKDWTDLILLAGPDWDLRTNENFLPDTVFGNGESEGHTISYFFQLQPVPEPATLLLWGSGLIGVAGFRRR